MATGEKTNYKHCIVTPPRGPGACGGGAARDCGNDLAATRIITMILLEICLFTFCGVSILIALIYRGGVKGSFIFLYLVGLKIIFVFVLDRPQLLTIIVPVVIFNNLLANCQYRPLEVLAKRLIAWIRHWLSHLFVPHSL